MQQSGLAELPAARETQEWMALQGARHSLLAEVTGWLLFLRCQQAQMAFAARSANLHEKRSATN